MPKYKRIRTLVVNLVYGLRHAMHNHSILNDEWIRGTIPMPSDDGGRFGNEVSTMWYFDDVTSDAAAMALIKTLKTFGLRDAIVELAELNAAGEYVGKIRSWKLPEMNPNVCA